MKRVNNKDCRPYVERREPFQGSNLYGNWHEDGKIYAVFSYGDHWPLFVWDGVAGKWFGNSDKYSSSTSRHSRLAEPYNAPIEWKDHVTMLTLAAHGVVGTIQQKINSSIGIAA